MLPFGLAQLVIVSTAVSRDFAERKSQFGSVMFICVAHYRRTAIAIDIAKKGKAYKSEISLCGAPSR